MAANYTYRAGGLASLAQGGLRSRSVCGILGVLTGALRHFPDGSSMASKPIYRIVFHNQGEIWELYARDIFQSDLWGFIEVEAFVFQDATKLVVDPASEKLRRTFEGVNRSYIPLNAIVRIDEVEREGAPKAVKAEGKVAEFPRPMSLPPRDDS